MRPLKHSIFQEHASISANVARKFTNIREISPGIYTTFADRNQDIRVTFALENLPEKTPSTCTYSISTKEPRAKARLPRTVHPERQLK